MADTADSLFARALALHRVGDLAAAEPAYRQALDLDAKEPRATQLLGVLAFQTGRTPRAVELLRRAADLAPNSADCHGNLGLVLAAHGQPAEAVAAYRRAIALRPDFAEAHVNLGTALQQSGDIDGALAAYRDAARADPDLPEAHHNLGLLLAAAGRWADAVAPLRRACDLRPDGGAEHLALGDALARTDDPAGAAVAYAAGLAALPANADAWNNLGTMFDRLGRSAEAADAFGHAVALRPDLAEGHFNHAVALRALGRHADAVAAVGRALSLRPTWPQAWNNRGVWLHESGDLAGAADAFARAIAAQPDYADAHCNVGNLWRQAGGVAEAIAAYRRALALRPDYPEALSNLGATLARAGDVDDAIATLGRAIALRPDLSEAHNNLGNALKDAGDLNAALASFARATALRPDDAAADSNRVYTLLFHPAYDARAIAAEHRRWARRHARPLARFAQPHDNDRDPGRRLRVGYVSPNLRDHVVGRNLLPLFERHDRDRFEITCYADSTDRDPIVGRFRAAVDHWRETSALTDAALADRVRADRIDVLVDLTLHMAGHRLLTFARRPAPVQVTFAGYPGSTGLAAIDYRLSDPHLDPPGTDPSVYAERTVCLPHSFWCYDPHEAGDLAVGPLPAAAANGVVTFGCLNNFCKVNDGVLNLWAAVLRTVPQSRLLLSAAAGEHRRRTVAVLAAAGVAANRVAFVDRRPHRQYLQQYHQVDVGLDTVPYNGHTTTLDALWMGVPVVTLVGQTIVGRAGLSQLTNLGLPGLIAHTPEQFVQAATDLARDLVALARLRSTLRPRMAASPLTDAAAFTRAVESAYRDAWAAWCDSPGTEAPAVARGARPRTVTTAAA